MRTVRLYILSGSEFDDEFFRIIVERVADWRVPSTAAHDACHHLSFIGIGDDDPEEMKRFFLNLRAKARSLGGSEPVYLLALRDNDRGPFSPTPGHPETTYPLPAAKTHRLRQLEFCRDLIHQADGHGLVYPCAVGVCLQMIETWILLALNPSYTEADLPLFAEKASHFARAHHGPGPVPPQLKDRYDQISNRARRQSRREFNRKAAQSADLDSLAARSPSFAAFRSELLALARQPSPIPPLTHV